MSKKELIITPEDNLYTKLPKNKSFSTSSINKFVTPSKLTILTALTSRKRSPLFPPASNNAVWQTIAADVRYKSTINSVLERATNRLDSPWPELLASDYISYRQTGERRSYEFPYFERRDRLGTAAIAFALSGDKRFLHEAAMGIWLICDEMTWSLPAHAQKDSENSTIDLFVCHTAHLIAETCSLLDTELTIYAPVIIQRAKKLVRKRVIDPIIEGKSWWWMTAGTSNWGPWCASGIVAAACWCEDDINRLTYIIYNMLRIGENFVTSYPNDGGCDEGVKYWIHATGSLIDMLEIILHTTDISMYADEKLIRMVRFPSTLSFGNGIFPAFSDSVPIIELPVGLCWRAGIRTNSSELHEMLLTQAPMKLGADNHTGNTLMNLLRLFFWTDDNYIPKAPLPPLTLAPKNEWLPDLQVLIARSSGTALAVKAGHNKENHNHNDVGQFVVYYAGIPIIVDAGRLTYTQMTFGRNRYKLWWTRGSGHAVPVVGGHEQQNGSQYTATDVRYNSDKINISFTADLAKCYAKEAGIIKLNRNVVFDRSTGRVMIIDSINQRTSQTVTLTLLAASEPMSDSKKNVIFIGPMLLELNDISVTSIERVSIAAGSLLDTSWAGGLWRINLEAKPGINGIWKLILIPKNI